ncbi:hypothetical protein [Peribacillus sp. FSL E2-0218]|uniref:hypothetical protein n=1 Tax=Peribacillus sp. FSL E2-0218 TaxID=2921364 RepID=UPI0030EEFB5E
MQDYLSTSYNQGTSDHWQVENTIKSVDFSPAIPEKRKVGFLSPFVQRIWETPLHLSACGDSLGHVSPQKLAPFLTILSA